MNDLNLFLFSKLTFKKVDIRNYYLPKSILPKIYHESNILTIDDIDMIFLIKKTWFYTYVQMRYRSNIPDYKYNNMSITIVNNFYSSNIKKKNIYFNLFNRRDDIQLKINKYIDYEI